ncbi:MAG: hypothetical protein H6779_02520 [Candidatus Nomurabacteria bacterium]|nr:hypothetical protein [Candidatus Nomurabacteria bacterium]USN87263.1 MAG: hypothetical protein H6779_02520 [Candidatus Nomurabacteria bacterium]
MSKLNELLSQIDPSAKSPTKEELWDLIKASLEEIGSINELYKKFFEGDNGSEAVLPAIEQKIQDINNAYTKIFPNGSIADTSVVNALQTQVDAIKAYHAELISNPDSIQTDIKDSQQKITDFYVDLLGGDGTSGKAKEIRDFYTKLTETDGIEEETKRIYTEITEKYEELFDAPEGENSEIQNLEANIKKAELFKKKIDTEVTPEIEETRKYLKDLRTDIDTKREDVNSLLSDATTRTLLNAYTESKSEYSKFKRKEFIKGAHIENVLIFFHNILGRHVGSVMNYAMFILPLVGVSLIFVNEKTAEIVLNSLTAEGVTPSALELIYVKTIISIPLIWIAWYGQRNISQRKRLFEEYNHKLRVVEMYLLFNTGDKSYQLDTANKDKLAQILLEAIEHNPAEHLGRGETIIDRVSERFHVEGFYKKMKNEVIESVKDVKDIATKNSK